MSNKSGISNQIISLPHGGGALQGIGEKFSPDLHTGTGNFTVPIALPPGRNGFQPQLNLVYSTGNGNGAFGLGWGLSIPGVSRQTSKGIPRYDEDKDIFIISGAEDLVPVSGNYPGRVRYQPRTEGLFARIEHQKNTLNDFWEVKSKDGLTSCYGTPRPEHAPATWHDPAVIANPAARDQIFAWQLSETSDPFGNRILYTYRRDFGQTSENPPQHAWEHLYLQQIRYVEYHDGGTENFLVSVTFEYEDRPDAFSAYRAGFEIRTRLRCSRIVVKTHPSRQELARHYGLSPADPALKDHILVRAYRLIYRNDTQNGVSLLHKIHVIGYDDAGVAVEELPPLEFGYSRFEPQGRRFFAVQGTELPAQSLASPNLELVDLFGNGLPDILEMNGSVRYWRNLGDGCFDLPRPMRDAPAGLSLADPGVQMIDADGDGRADLLASLDGLSGYFPLRFDGTWDRRSFHRFQMAPSFNLEDPEVKLVDLDGDGLTDVIRSGTRFECFFNDPERGWTPDRTRWVSRQALEVFPNVNFSDPRVKWGDMSGDGMQDIVLVYDGNVEYWPNFGRGRWGRRIHMANSPRFPYGYDPRRILIGDVDGDGLADIVYVDHRKVCLWTNQSGNRWSDPVEIEGTPPVSDMDAVRLVDLLGSGISGVLWSADANGSGRPHLYFLDFTGRVKPYLLDEMDNHMGAVTKVAYQSSTHYYLADQASREWRWKTPLPFPVQVVARVEVIDEISRGKLATEYCYHHGYWDGAEREFRGFGMVEQRDSEDFQRYNRAGLHGEAVRFNPVADHARFSPPTLTKTWFHQGPVGEVSREWEEMDYSAEYWSEDPLLLGQQESIATFLRGLPNRNARRDALRSLRGSILRSELYALDDTDRQDRPYTVTEITYGLREESAPPPGVNRVPIFFPHQVAQHTTQWERGEDPMKQFSFTGKYDRYGLPGEQISIAVPRGRKPDATIPAGQPAPEPYLATHTLTKYVQRDDCNRYMVDRVAKTTTFEMKNDGRADIFNLKSRIESRSLDLPDHIISQTRNYYDGPAFIGFDVGQIGDRGALTRTESLVLTEAILHDAYRSGSAVLAPAEEPPYLARSGAPTWAAEYPQAFRDALPAMAGYIFHPGGQPNRIEARGFFSQTERRSYDFQQPGANGKGRGLVLVQLDPLGNPTTIAYDHELLPCEVKDPVGLITKVDYLWRTMQPCLVTDPNGNETQFYYSPLGLLKETWIKGNPAKHEGDRKQPGARLEYDLLAFQRSQQQSPNNPRPAFVRTIRHVHHDTETDIPQPAQSETIETREYSDGFGRLIQTRMQAEEVIFALISATTGEVDLTFGNDVLPAQQPASGGDVRGYAVGDPVNRPHIVVSGWQTYDNKGRVIEKYEPFFAEGWAYAMPEDAQLGQKATMFYDPRGQIVRTHNADGSVQRIIYGTPDDLDDPERFTPTPWEVFTYDANDNAGRTHPVDAQDYRHHWNTPTNFVLDALGRSILTIERSRVKPSSRTDLLAPIEEYHTRSTYDMRSNLLTVTDALGRVAFRYIYDLANRVLRMESIDAGVRRSVLDASGNGIELRDGKGALMLRAYDQDNRLTYVWARDDSNSAVALRERAIYGDDPGTGLTPAQVSVGNLLGRLYRYDDEAGRLTITTYDFKGNVLEKERQVIADSEILATLNAPAISGTIKAYLVDWDSPPTLEGQYQTSTTYDALNRVKSLKYPEDVQGSRKTLVPYYNPAGGLERVELDGKVYVQRIAFNAKGQRTLVAYGNGVMTRCAYDAQTFRLARMRSERFTQPSSLVYHPDTSLPVKDRVVQDLAYEYDLAGNITNIHDRAPNCGVIDSPAGKDALDQTFVYDPLYRLILATGRECKTIPGPRPWEDWHSAQNCGYGDGKPSTPNQDNASDLTALYWERYSYDPAGNIVALSHRQGSAMGWTRHFGMGGYTPNQWRQEWHAHHIAASGWTNPPGNRLTHVGDNQPGGLQTHFYDDSGNLIHENTERHFRWDHSNRLVAFAHHPMLTSLPSVEACYLYDKNGQRVKKYTRNQQGQIEVTVYLDGIFEYNFRSADGWGNNLLHVMDDKNRIVIVRVGKAFSDDGAPGIKVKYQFGDHLGSSSVVIGGETNTADQFVNREEYFPYGEASFGCYSRKRYRFTGKERDEESGLYYFGARFYAPWLQRWTRCDPVQAYDSLNLYVYGQNNPIRLIDSTGNAVDLDVGASNNVKSPGPVSSGGSTSSSGTPWTPPNESSTPAPPRGNSSLSTSKGTLNGKPNQQPNVKPSTGRSTSPGTGVFISLLVGQVLKDLEQIAKNMESYQAPGSRNPDVPLKAPMSAPWARKWLPPPDCSGTPREAPGHSDPTPMILPSNETGTSKMELGTPSLNRREEHAYYGYYWNPYTNDIEFANEVMATDHIYPEKLITQLPGFDRLTPEQQYLIKNHPDNFQPLPKSLNSSKGAKTAKEWQEALGQSFHPDYIRDAIKIEQGIKSMLQAEINRMIANNEAAKRASSSIWNKK